MKNKFRFITVFIVFVSLASCKSDAEKAAEKAKSDSLAKANLRTASLDSIKKLEKMMNDKNAPYNPRLAMEALKEYSDFTVRFPDDSLTPEFLFRSSLIAQTTGNFKQAAIYLEQIIEKHKGYPQYADACYGAANLYRVNLASEPNSADRAKTLYQYVIDHYPNTYMAESSKTLIEYIGKPDSVLINDVLKKAGIQDNEK